MYFRMQSCLAEGTWNHSPVPSNLYGELPQIDFRFQTFLSLIDEMLQSPGNFFLLDSQSGESVQIFLNDVMDMTIVAAEESLLGQGSGLKVLTYFRFFRSLFHGLPHRGIAKSGKWIEEDALFRNPVAGQFFDACVDHTGAAAQVSLGLVGIDFLDMILDGYRD